MARNASINRKSKRPSAGHQPGALRQILTNTRLAGLLLLSCLFLATMMGLTIWGDRGLLAMWRKQREVAGVVQEIEAIEREGIRAVYREPQFGSTLLDVIAAESGARVLTLRSIPDDEVTTYIELVRTNALALAEGLSPSLASAAAE